ncbi:hypothetical protein QYE76_026602 [Lolium multiflorum]|uniref:Uncharacterized protein n=1 Tax=Lolium multiflorum TaxID=4521 RepID=A0AAD8RHV9_LOLMU|nr:hypothetical protein QYE76_026602 [Lolium multiflorum]
MPWQASTFSSLLPLRRSTLSQRLERHPGDDAPAVQNWTAESGSKTLVHPALRGAQVLELLDGTDVAPVKHLEVEDTDKNKQKVANPAYAAWVARDSTVLSWILNSLSPEILAHTIGVDSTAAVWEIITNLCGSRSRSRINQLRGALQSTKKLDMTASVFFAKMKAFASELAAAGKPVEEDEMVGYLVNGLDASYNDVAAAVNGNSDTTIDDLYDQIVAHDMRQEMLSDNVGNVGFTSSANAARRGQDTGRGDRGDRAYGQRSDDRRRDDSDRRRDDGDRRRDDSDRRRDDGTRWDDRRRDNGSGQARRDGGGQRWDDRRPQQRRDGGYDRRRDDGGRRRGHGHVPTPFVDVTCQICTIHGHLASDCWWRFKKDDSNDEDSGRGKKGANIASYGVDSNWYSDTGATDHITSELNKPTTSEKYKGQDRVHTADGNAPASVSKHSYYETLPPDDDDESPSDAEHSDENLSQNDEETSENSFQQNPAENDELGADSEEDSLATSDLADPEADPASPAAPAAHSGQQPTHAGSVPLRVYTRRLGQPFLSRTRQQ